MFIVLRIYNFDDQVKNDSFHKRIFFFSMIYDTVRVSHQNGHVYSSQGGGEGGECTQALLTKIMFIPLTKNPLGQGFTRHSVRSGIDNPYLVGEMFNNVSPYSVRFGRTCPANLGVQSEQETHMPSPVEPYPRLTGKQNNIENLNLYELKKLQFYQLFKNSGKLVMQSLSHAHRHFLPKLRLFHFPPR